MASPVPPARGEPLQSHLRSGPPRFDPVSRTWTLSRYPDVVAALKHERIVVPGGGAAGPRPVFPLPVAGVFDTVGPPRLGRAPGAAGSTADSRTEALDLLADVASPWALALALVVTGASEGAAEQLGAWGREVFEAAAEARGFGVAEGVAEASSALASALGGAEGAWRAQAFVALSQTLPRLLASIWVLVAEDAGLVADWRARSDSRVELLDELIRIASPSRFVFRTAAGAVEIGGASIAVGDAVHLALGAANHDPETFPDPLEPRRGRSGPPHLGFGRGAHACPGSRLVRRAAHFATDALIEGVEAITLAAPVHWEGHAIRTPRRLRVRLVGAG